VDGECGELHPDRAENSFGGSGSGSSADDPRIPGPVGDVSTSDEPAIGDPTVPVGEPRRNAWNLILVVVCAVLLIGSGALVVWSRARSSEASRARTEAADLDSQRAALVDQADRDGQHRNQLDSATGDASWALHGASSAFSDASGSWDAFVTVANQAIDLSNTGKVAASNELLNAEVDPALANVAATTEAADTKLADAQAKLQHLNEVSNG